MEIKIEEGILIGKYPDDLSVTLEIAKQMVAERLEFQNGIEYPVLIHFNGMSFASYEARKYLEKEGASGIIAGAFIINSAVESFIVNLYFILNKPSVPSRIFSKGKENEAIKWLQQFK